MIAGGPSIGDAAFWHQPLAARMAQFAELRERGPFTRATFTDPLTGEEREFFAATRYADVVEISRRPLDFCSGQGSTSINDLPQDAMEFFGSFIVMDDPRHARQRGIVARAFTPRHLQSLLDSVERTCAEVIDGICERGEVDLVETVSQPFPLLVICDMMGIPRSEFSTVLRATNVILGAGDPDMLGGREDVFGALLEAGMELTNLMNELAAHRRVHPADDLTTALVHNDLGEDMLAPNELAQFFILLAVAGNDTTRTAISLGMHLLAEHPDQRAIWQADVHGATLTAVEEIVRAASPVVFMRRTATRDLSLSGHDFREGDKVVLFYGAANRDPRVFDDPEHFDVLRDPNPHLGFGGTGAHYCLGANLAKLEINLIFNALADALPDITLIGEPKRLRSGWLHGIKEIPVAYKCPVPH
jgi:methyl-branched lipid omega-hydroxylase